MGFIDLLFGGKKKTEEKLEITPQIKNQVAQLGIKETDVCGYKNAIRVLCNYEGEGFKTLSRFPSNILAKNHGLPYSAIEQYGPQRINELLDRYGEESRDNIWDLAKTAEKTGFDTIDKVIEEYGLSKVRTIAPIYPELKEARNKTGEEIKQYDIRFSGEVQDVGFRGTAVVYAALCGIKGYVQNEPGGSVFCEVQGTDSMINVFVLAMERNFKVSKIKKEESKFYHKEDKFVSI